MKTNVLNRLVPDGYQPFQGAHAYRNMTHTIMPEVKTTNQHKVIHDIGKLFDRLDIQDGMTLSFHHHLREGDAVMNMVLAEIKRRKLQNMTLAPVKVYKRSMKESEEESMLILQRLGIEEIAQSYPSQVSGGQGQRAAIARGLILRPDYMLLDEPTSALDANTTDEFAQWLVELKEETNFIIVTHDILFARRAASVGVYLTEGKVADMGNIDDIVSHLHSSGNVRL